MTVTNMRQPPESGRIAFMGRRFHFSLRCLFVIVTAFCVWLGFQANSAQKQRAAVAKIESVGGYIEKRSGIWESVQVKRQLQQELPGCKIELLDGMTASAGEATEADEMKFVNRRNGARGRRRKMPGS